MRCALIAAIPMALSIPAVAQEASGNAGEGETIFDRQCAFCHVIQDPDGEGEAIAGRDGGSGPNLFGVVGSTPGSRYEQYEYSDDLVACGETGVTWGDANLVSYVQSPSDHLREALDDSGARSKMSYKLRNEQDARDVQAYLARFAVEDAASKGNSEERDAKNES